MNKHGSLDSPSPLCTGNLEIHRRSEHRVIELCDDLMLCDILYLITFAHGMLNTLPTTNCSHLCPSQVDTLQKWNALANKSQTRIAITPADKRRVPITSLFGRMQCADCINIFIINYGCGNSIAWICYVVYYTKNR